MAACGDKNNDDEYTTMDRDWDTQDSAFLVDYSAVRSQYDSLEGQFKTLPASNDTTSAAERAKIQARLDAQRQKLEEMETKRTAARSKRDAARTAKDKAAYENARKDVDYAAWKAELDRIRSEQGELQGTIKIGGKTVGAIDANVKDTSKPLLRVEPGKKDDKPLIELNKNPK
jgi:chromosome segregation ATPase